MGAAVGTVRAEGQTVAANEVTEVRLVSGKAYKDPFNEAELTARVTRPDGTTFEVPGFWDGGDKWAFRFAAGQAGSYRWRTECTDARNGGLNGVEGKIEVTAYAGDDPLYRHGGILVAEDHRHLAYSDGTPFFWLGDTWWKGLSGRLPWDRFQKLTVDRKEKGFTAVQIVAGPYPDEREFDPGWGNEGGLPYEADFARVNPKYFDCADRRIKLLCDDGIVPAIVGGWAGYIHRMGVEKMKRHWRYLIARYGAYPVAWILGGEATDDPVPWTEVAEYVRKIDGYHRAITIHPTSGCSSRETVTHDGAIDFNILQTGHNDMFAAPGTVALLSWERTETPPMPVLDSEVTYEGHMMSNREDVQRYMFWTCMMNGAAGHTYGAGGMWQMNSETARGSTYEFTPWFTAMDFPGSRELGLGKKLLERYQWWRFEPHQEWVEPHGDAIREEHPAAEGHAEPNKRWAAMNGNCELPYAAGIPGETRFVFLPGRHYYDWTPPLIRGLEAGAKYRAFYFNPVTAREFDLGIVTPPAGKRTTLFEDRFGNEDGSAWEDKGTATKRTGGELKGGKGMLTVVKKINEADLEAETEALSNSEAGVVLRFHDVDHYLVGLYSPVMKAIYIHDRDRGDYGAPLGKVVVSELGPKIHLTMEVRGAYAQLSVTDGQHVYTTPNVKVANLAGGNAGVWHYQIGDTQSFSGFAVSRLAVGRGEQVPDDPLAQGGFSFISATDGNGTVGSYDYIPPRLPVPQDWVLVMERR